MSSVIRTACFADSPVTARDQSGTYVLAVRLRRWRSTAGRVLPILVGAWSCAQASGEPQTRNIRDDVARLSIRHRTEHYAISGTVSDARLAEYGRLLEYIHKEYADGFAELLDGNRHGTDQRQDKRSGQRGSGRSRSGRSPRGGSEDRDDRGAAKKATDGDEHRFRVVIFARKAEYDEFGAAYFGRFSEHTSGMFVPSVDLLLISDADGPDETYGVLFHEAFHQFLRKHVPLAPTWLNEGLATYYGTARPTGKGLVFSESHQGFFRIVRDAESSRKLLPLDQLMIMSRAAFYNQSLVAGKTYTRRSLAYAEAYTLTLYLLGDNDGRSHLQDYIRALAAAKSAADAIEVTKSRFPKRVCDAMTRPWMKVVNRN